MGFDGHPFHLPKTPKDALAKLSTCGEERYHYAALYRAELQCSFQADVLV
jgi:hypothetical protein